jgi:hypothetical protein
VSRSVQTAVVLSTLAWAFLTPGCTHMPSVEVVRYELERQVPGVRFERESHLRLGRVAMAFVKPIVRRSLDEDDEARRIVTRVRRLDIATYRVVAMPATIEPAALARLERRITRAGWSPVIRSTEDDSSTWVYSRPGDGGSIAALLVVELDGDELSVVGVEGRLDEVLAAAIADEPGELVDRLGS